MFKAIARAWSDKAFYKQLLENPIPALASVGLIVSVGFITFVPVETQVLDEMITENDNGLEVKLSQLPEHLYGMTEEELSAFLGDLLDWLGRLCST